MLTHRNLVANLAQHDPVQPIAPGDVFCAVLPFFHIYGLTLVLNAALRNGATVVTLPRFDPEQYLSAIERYRVSRLHLVPPIVLSLASSPLVTKYDLSSVRSAICGAAPLDGELAKEAAARIGVPIVQGYGMTEASPGTHFVPDNDRAAQVPSGSVGYLVPGTRARLVSVETELDTAGEGELWVSGPQVMSGYLDEPEATAATLVDGWLRTGDVARVEPGGAFFIVDRVKELIKYKGYQVAPAELEAVLLGHPEISDAAVVGIPSGAVGEIPKAYVVTKRELTPSDVLDYVAERVAPYKKLRDVEFVTSIPRSPSGKILRRVLRDAARAG
jgi:acyl-CoA synthetase (AMP-forming)/AMP-acid ligase II